MKKIHKLVITTYLAPFALTFFITLFILVMQFLWKYIDDLVGKGLEINVIAELLFYATANLIPMALPLAILLSSIMTFGNLGEHYELVALKSSGLSLQRIMLPLMFVIAFTSLSAFYFSNNIWPVANLKMATLLYDVRQKKPAFDIKEQVFYKGIDNYAIRVGKKGKDGQTIYDVMIYDHSRNNGNTRVVKAESGKMQMTDDELFLILTLYNGTSYEEAEAKDDNKKKKENTYPFFRSKFKEHITRLDLSSFSMQKTDEELFKDNYQMLNIKQINREVDTIKAELTENYIDFQKQMNEKTLLFADSVQIEKVSGTKKFDSELFKGYKKEEITKLLDFADNYTRNSRSYTITTGTGIESKEYSIIRYIVEWHRKFTLSVACIVLFFIGAPLGAIIRKGGLGMPVVVSVIFFLVFHTLSITGEKLAKQGELEPGYGMWLATVILAPIGVFLTYKATTDSVLLDTDFYYKLIRPAIGIFKKKKE